MGGDIIALKTEAVIHNAATSMNSKAITNPTANESILRAYSLSSQDVRAEPLLTLSLDRKLQLFKHMQLLSSEDYKLLQD